MGDGFVRPLTDEQLRVPQHILDQLREPAPITANLMLALGLNGDLILDFDGRRYRIPPVSYQDGVQLEQLRIRLAALGDEPETIESLMRLHGTLSEAIEIFARLAVPLHRAPWWARCWRRLRRRRPTNPFADVTSREVAELLGFFRIQATKSRCHPSPSTSSNGGPRGSTSPTTSPGSSAPTPAGLTP